MKKLSLFGLLGLAGLLAFIATPIYAQEEDINVDDENIIVEADDITMEAEDIVADVQDVLEEWEEVVTSEEPFLGSEELENILWELNVDEMSKEDAMATTWVGWLILGLFAGLGIVGWIIGIVLWILRIIALWKAFERAWEWWWKAIIPIYCSYIKYKLAGMKNWFWYVLLFALVMWIIAACLPDQQVLITNIATVVTWIVFIVMTFKFAKKYGWGTFASILFVLFYPICILVLGFGDYMYQWESEETVVEA